MNHPGTVNTAGAVSNHSHALKKSDGVQSPRRVLVERHLDLVLTGSLKDSGWTRAHRNAVNDRVMAYRKGGAWAYFQPVPAKPRARVPTPVSIRRRDWITAVGCSAILIVTVGKLGQKAVALDRPVPMLACPVLLVYGYVAAVQGLRWHYFVSRLRTKERQHTARRGALRPPEGGFAGEADRDFEHYFAIYVPNGVKLRSRWPALPVSAGRCVTSSSRSIASSRFKRGR